MPSALISGASIAGLSAAFWLLRAGWEVQLIERAEGFREGGQNVDVRGTGRSVIERMGLTEAVRARTTTEVGARFLDAHGRVAAEFPQESADGLTAEFEILRGDLSGLLRDALPAGTEIRYGTTIDQVQPHGDRAQVRLSSGETDAWDLVVVAEGVRSATRAAVFGGEVTTRPLHTTMVYGTIPRISTDDRWWNWYTTTRARQVTLRPDPVGTTRATLAFMSRTDRLTGVEPDERMAILREMFADAGWQAERVLEGFETSDDVYADFLTQIRAERWSRGRVVMIGDAAWCPTPFGGGGSSLAMTGGYALAAFLERHPDDVLRGLEEFERWMRPLVDGAHELPPGVPRLAFPCTRPGLVAHNTLFRAVGRRPLRPVVEKVMAGSEEQPPPLP